MFRLCDCVLLRLALVLVLVLVLVLQICEAFGKAALAKVADLVTGLEPERSWIASQKMTGCRALVRICEQPRDCSTDLLRDLPGRKR
jgi:hypothetical protein